MVRTGGVGENYTLPTPLSPSIGHTGMSQGRRDGNNLRTLSAHLTKRIQTRVPLGDGFVVPSACLLKVLAHVAKRRALR